MGVRVDLNPGETTPANNFFDKQGCKRYKIITILFSAG
jgi:hypothetical protein